MHYITRFHQLNNKNDVRQTIKSGVSSYLNLWMLNMIHSKIFIYTIGLEPTIGLHNSTNQPGVDSLAVSFLLNEFQYSIRHLV